MTELSFGRKLWSIAGLGTAISFCLSFALVGEQFDIDSFGLAASALNGPNPFEAYSELNSNSFHRYPYLPGFFPWLFAADFVADRTSLPFHGLVQVPAVLANLGLALIVQAYLGARGSDERTRLLSAGAIVLGPVFIGISGYHGQIDALAILPAVIALVVWEGRTTAVLETLRPGGTWGAALAEGLDRDPIQRAVACGILIGIGAALKTVPLFMLIPLLLSARSRREGVVLVGTAIALPLLLLAPFLIADPRGVETLLHYRGVPGFGGLSLALQPSIAVNGLVGDPLALNAASWRLHENGGVIVLLMLAAVLAFGVRFRPAPLDLAVLLWVAFYALAPNFAFQYLTWGIPFFLMAGHIRATLLLQAAVLVPFLIAHLAPWSSREVAAVYVAIMLVVWAGFVVALFRLARRMITASEDPSPGIARA